MKTRKNTHTAGKSEKMYHGGCGLAMHSQHVFNQKRWIIGEFCYELGELFSGHVQRDPQLSTRGKNHIKQLIYERLVEYTPVAINVECMNGSQPRY